LSAQSPEVVVMIVRDRRNENIFHISDKGRYHQQTAYGLKLPGSKQEGALRAGRPAYYFAQWAGIGWNLAGEATAQDW
jgi:hypothetical protein